ncbi:MAG: hypothetical protein WCC04_00415 [Terriglobales bacterium]
MISNEDVNQLPSADSAAVRDRDEQVEESAEQPRKRIAFLDGPAEVTLRDQMERPSGHGTAPPANEQPSAIVAESTDVRLSEIPKEFNENFFLSANLPNHVLMAHARTMTEEEIRKFVDDAARAAGCHANKLTDIIVLASPFILREREFYDKQGRRDTRGKLWTERKAELATAFGASVRTFERALTEMLKPTTMEYNLSIPGLIEGLSIKFDKDRLPEIETLVARCGLLAAPSESSDPVIADSPESLWKIIDGTLNDAIESVFFVDDPREFATRLGEFARAVADNFFPKTKIEITPAPAKDETL